MDRITVCGSLPVYVKIAKFFVSVLGSCFRTEVMALSLLPFLGAMSLHTCAFPDMMTFELDVLMVDCTRYIVVHTMHQGALRCSGFSSNVSACVQ